MSQDSRIPALKLPKPERLLFKRGQGSACTKKLSKRSAARDLGGPTYWKSEPLCVSHGTRHSDVQIGVNLAPFMIHELLLSPTETASGSHPCCVVLVTYHRPSYFHGDDAGSNRNE